MTEAAVMAKDGDRRVALRTTATGLGRVVSNVHWVLAHG